MSAAKAAEHFKIASFVDSLKKQQTKSGIHADFESEGFNLL